MLIGAITQLPTVRPPRAKHRLQSVEHHRPALGAKHLFTFICRCGFKSGAYPDANDALGVISGHILAGEVRDAEE